MSDSRLGARASTRYGSPDGAGGQRSVELTIEPEAGVRLVGTLALPAADRPVAVVAAAHGASAGTRDAVLLAHLREWLPTLGVGCLTYDRRGEGSSTGELAATSFEDLGRDLAAWVRLLRARPEVDADRIVLWGHSQGGWIAPLAAAAGGVRAIACFGACGTTPAHQMIYAATTQVAEAGYPPDAVEQARAVREYVDEHFRGRVPLAEAQAAVAAVRDEPWFALADVPALPPASDGRWPLIMDFDVRPVLRRLSVPTLLLFGESDRWVSIAETIETWRDCYGDPSRIAVERIAGTGHLPTVADDPADPLERGPVSDVYERWLAGWLQRALAPLADAPSR